MNANHVRSQLRHQPVFINRIMIPKNKLYVVYNPGTCGRFLKLMCLQMLTHHDRDIELSTFGSVHPMYLKGIITPEFITGNSQWVLVESHTMPPMDADSKYIFIKTSDYKLALKLHFIKRYYEENNFDALNHPVDLSSIDLSEIHMQHTWTRIFQLIDEIDVRLLAYQLPDIPSDNQHNILHLRFEDIYSGNPTIIEKIEKFLIVNANESTYINLARYAAAQTSPDQFLATFNNNLTVNLAEGIGIEPMIAESKSAVIPFN